MKRTLVLLVASALLGAVVGAGVTRALARRHQHARAVMWLAQYHLQGLDAAVASQSCPGFRAQLGSLRFVHGELLQAFPLAVAQDAEFGARAAALQSALQAAAADGSECTAMSPQARRIRDACDACHREYR
jgi:hypothetical protein